MLEKQRQQIDDIDRRMVRLFEERMQVVLEVAAIKRENNLPILDASREEELLNKLVTYLEEEALAPYVRELYLEVMQLSKKYQAAWLDEHGPIA